MITFTLILYPPFQVAVTYIALSILLGYTLNNYKSIKKKFRYIIPVILVALILFFLFFFFVYNRYSEIVELITNTSYPGARFIQAGSGNILHLFNGFYNLLLQIESNTPPFANQSESSNFFLLFPPIILWVIYKSIKNYLEFKKIDWVPILLSLNLVFFAISYLFPLPDFISKYSLLYLVHPNRLLIGFGYGSYLLMFYLIGNIFGTPKNKPDKIISIILAFLFGLLIYGVGVELHSITPSFFTYPSIIGYEYKILLASIFSTLIIFLLLNNYKKLFLIGFLAFSIISTIFINPLYKGLDILINTDLANYISEISIKDDSKWVGYNNNYLTQYALANNASVINGIHLYPQFRIWEVLDPEQEYVELYNRYAHINVSEYEEGEEYIRLMYNDALEVNISPCDEKWDTLNVKYIITYQEMSYSCLNLKKEFPEYEIKIYERTLPTQLPTL
jgi:hypothetical protein